MAVQKPVIRGVGLWTVSTAAGGAGWSTVALRRRGVGSGQDPIAVIETG